MSFASSLSDRLSDRPIAVKPARVLTGPQKAAAILLALGERYSQPLWSLLDDDEIRTISIAMSQLGQVEPEMVEKLLSDFSGKLSVVGAISGSFDRTESLLAKLLPKDRADQIMQEIRGPAGRNMWQKLSNVQDEVLAAYLKNEYPQTVAVIMSKIKAEHAARVLAILPDDFAVDVINRMLKMENVQKEVLERIEDTLRTEFIANLSMTQRRDAHELMAEIFNSFDRTTEVRFLSALDERNPRLLVEDPLADVHLRRSRQARSSERSNSAARRRQGCPRHRAQGRAGAGAGLLLVQHVHARRQEPQRGHEWPRTGAPQGGGRRAVENHQHGQGSGRQGRDHDHEESR